MTTTPRNFDPDTVAQDQVEADKALKAFFADLRELDRERHERERKQSAMRFAIAHHDRTNKECK